MKLRGAAANEDRIEGGSMNKIKVLAILIILIAVPFTLKSQESTISPEQAVNIIKLKGELVNGRYENYLSNRYGQFVSHAALQLLEEEQLHVIGDKISLGALMFPNRVQELIDKLFPAAYIELDHDSKDQLVGLFINANGSNTSYYFKDPQIQDLVQMAFIKLLLNDGISLEKVVTDFFENNPLHSSHPYITGELENVLNTKSR